MILKSGVEVGKSALFSRQHILNYLVTYSLKPDSNVQKFNECLTVQHCPIGNFYSQKQETESFVPLVYAMKEMDWWPCIKAVASKVSDCQIF